MYVGSNADVEELKNILKLFNIKLLLSTMKNSIFVVIN